MDTPSVSQKTDWTRSFVVYCRTRAQKELLVQTAARSNRSLSSYALNLLLQREGDASIEAEDLQRARKELRDARSLIGDMSRELNELREAKRKLGQDLTGARKALLAAGITAGPREAEDLRVIQTLALGMVYKARDRRDNPRPMKEADLIIALDRVGDARFCELLRERFEQLSDRGLLWIRSTKGERAYVWAGSAEDIPLGATHTARPAMLSLEPAASLHLRPPRERRKV